MNVIVCGGRGYADWMRVFSVLDALKAEFGPLTVIDGGARGADAWARRWVASNHTDCRRVTVPAEWDKFGGAAGPLRNRKMLKEHAPDLVIAFPGGRGTADMVRQAKRAGVLVRQVR